MGQVSLGYKQVTDVSTAGTLETLTGASIPAGATHARIQAESQDIRWRDDGVNPTAAIGKILKAGSDVPEYLVGVQLRKARFIQASATAKLNVEYYKS
jgi:hypothetical protein